MVRRIITTEAVGRRKAQPELATVEVIASGEGKSASGARAMARDRAATIRKSVRVAPTDTISTTNLRVNSSNELLDEGDAGYRATERLCIECPPDTAESVVTAVTDAGGTTQSVEFQLHETVRQQRQDEALGVAMERAREKAEQIAEAEELQIARVLEVTTDEPDTRETPFADEALERSQGADVEPSPTVVSEGVEVVYEITGA
jgi:uncharacterized protein YggE